MPYHTAIVNPAPGWLNWSFRPPVRPGRASRTWGRKLNFCQGTRLTYQQSLYPQKQVSLLYKQTPLFLTLKVGSPG